MPVTNGFMSKALFEKQPEKDSREILETKLVTRLVLASSSWKKRVDQSLIFLKKENEF